MSDREYDIIVFGATGFTGFRVVNPYLRLFTAMFQIAHSTRKDIQVQENTICACEWLHIADSFLPESSSGQTFEMGMQHMQVMRTVMSLAIECPSTE